MFGLIIGGFVKIILNVYVKKLEEKLPLIAFFCLINVGSMMGIINLVKRPSLF